MNPKITVKKVWKLTSVEDGEFWSYLGLASPSLNIHYKIGETTAPKINGSYIFAFDTLENAIEFLRWDAFRVDMPGPMTDFGYAILECSASVSKVRPASIPMCPDLINTYSGKTHAELFWHYRKRYQGDIRSVPTGTVFCNWVVPIQRVY